MLDWLFESQFVLFRLTGGMGSTWLPVVNQAADVTAAVCFFVIAAVIVRRCSRRQGAAERSAILPWIAAFIVLCGLRQASIASGLGTPPQRLVTLLNVACAAGNVGSAIAVLYVGLFSIVEHPDYPALLTRLEEELRRGTRKMLALRRQRDDIRRQRDRLRTLVLSYELPDTLRATLNEFIASMEQDSYAAGHD
jgi:hypothetical protein